MDSFHSYVIKTYATMNKPSAHHFVPLYISGRIGLMKSCLCEGVQNGKKTEAEKKGMGRIVKENQESSRRVTKWKIGLRKI